MRLAKARFVDPERNALFGIVAVALSVFVFAYSSRFGQVSILLYYAIWFPLIAVDYRHALGNYGKFLWIIGFGVFALLSVFWSQAPSVSLRAGIQYMTHVVCALVAARTIGMKTLARGCLAGVFVVLLFSLAVGTYQYDALDGTYSFVGAFASKNQLGFYASLGVYFAIAAVMLLRERGLWRIAALAIGALSAHSLFASQSATSIISVMAALLVVFAFSAFLFFSPKQRKASFAIGLVVVAAVAVVALNGGFLDILLGAFGKDTTLTGRTYLWSQGIEAGHAAPIFGIGYQAYWVQGFSEAERLWADFFITGRSGFHFHNTYIELYVETGIVGTGLMVLLLATTFAGHLKRLLSEKRNTVSHILIGIIAMLLVRSFLEIDIVTPYAIGSFLLYYAAGLIATRQERRVVARPGPAAQSGQRLATS